jgi:hypothetical protein
MAMITYDNKSTLNPQPSVADANKVKAEDMNEIKSVVNTNYGEVGNIANLNTTDKTSVVNAINELKGGDIYSKLQETLTNKVCGGKPVYRAYVEYSHASAGNFTYNHNLGIDTLVSATIMLSVANQTIASHGYRPNPYISGSNNFMVSQVTENTMISQATGWNNNKVYAWLEYTKTS